MSQIWYVHTNKVSKFLNHREKVHNVLGLITEMPIDGQGGCSVHVGHLEVMLEDVYHAFVDRLEERQEVLCE